MSLCGCSLSFSKSCSNRGRFLMTGKRQTSTLPSEEDPGCYRLLRLSSVREKGRETCEATSGVLCPLLASPVQEKHWYTGASSMEGHKNGEVLGAQDVWEKAEKAGSVTSWGREGWRETLVLSTPTYTIERRWGQTLLRGGLWQDKRQQMKEHGKFWFHMKIIFSCDGGQPPEPILRGLVNSPPLGIFKTQLHMWNCFRWCLAVGDNCNDTAENCHEIATCRKGLVIAT